MDKKDDLLGENVKKATKWSAVSNVIRKIITPVINMVLARLLTPDVFGIVASINIIISFADMLTDTGFQKYLIQHDFDSEDELSKSANVAFWVNLVISCVLLILIAIFDDELASAIGCKGNGKILLFAAFSIPLTSFSSVQNALFKRVFDFKTIFIPQLTASLLPFFVTIPLAYFTRSPIALVIGTVATKLSDAILHTKFSKWKPAFYFSFHELKKMFSYGSWMIIESFSVWFATNIDIFIIGKTMSEYELGLYQTSLITIAQIMSIITATVIPVMFSTMSRVKNDRNEMRETVYSFQFTCGLFTIPMSVGMFIFGDVVVWIMLGNEWLEAIPLISWLALFQAPIILICNFASEVYRAMGEPRVSFFVQMSYIGILAGGILYGTKNGFIALCVAKIILQAIFIMMHTIVLKFKYKFSIIRMITNVKEVLFASIIMGGVGYLIHSMTNSMFLKLLMIAVCAIIYFLMCVMQKKTRQYIKNFLTK